MWAKAFFKADEYNKLVVVKEMGFTRKGLRTDKEVTKITCLVCRKNVGYSRGSLGSALAHLKTHNIMSVDDATERLVRLVYQYAESAQPLPQQFYPKPKMATTSTTAKAPTHTLAEYGIGPAAATAGANTVLGRRFKRAAAKWVAAAGLPYSATDHPAFLDMCRVLDPAAPKIGRKAITSQVRIASVAIHCVFCILHGHDFIRRV